MGTPYARAAFGTIGVPTFFNRVDSLLDSILELIIGIGPHGVECLRVKDDGWLVE